ncbi:MULTISPECIES: regulatory protein RecX [unclassified Fusibacter]|uniref:regulatory protein RecX n=1 Tax=unclassified Fusibacter TaxID=2624464 RepID=UPI001013C287|nr:MULTISPECIES: regulatory protein RecX [unclassified Fusibacter]MCK8061709.1 recombination regulator RecX [Fusibacter sp. A2]NPE23881.1 regulatory protein RecX [Fusibacter sp. A1]RXV58505.1 regulatory protein RecX [Fusibacter sp. A1]
MLIIDEILKLKRGVYALRFGARQVMVSETQLVQHHLYKGQEIEEGLIKVLEKEFLNSQCLHKSIDIISRRNHFVKELRTKLLQKEFDREVIDDTIDRLIDEGYMDELETARQLVAVRSETDSKSKIKMRLIQRGCPENIVDLVLQDGTGDEFEKAMTAARKKLRQLEGEPEDKQKEKLMRNLLSKGFDYGVVRRVWEELQ